VKHNILQQVSAQVLGLFRPFCRARCDRRRRDAAQDERLHLQQSGTGREYFLPQYRLKVSRGALRESLMRKQKASEKRKTNHVDAVSQTHERLRL
jgi:hypothetical protein